MRGGTANRYSAEPPPTPVPDLMRPPWLISRFRLADAGPAEVTGRVARRLVATPRLPTDRVIAERLLARAHRRLDRIDLLVDADTGVVLRQEAVFDGQPLWIAELRTFVVDPPEARDPARFGPPAGVPDEDRGVSPTTIFTSMRASLTWTRTSWWVRAVSRPWRPRVPCASPP